MKSLCLGCKAKEEEREAVTVVAVGHAAWDVCKAHADRFTGYLAEVFQTDGKAPLVEERGSVVVTGTIPGYEPEAARLALENSGYRITGHVEKDTEFIVCGIRPAPHKVKEAEAAGTACLDATAAGRFREAVATNQWKANDPLPEVVAKKTAEDVKAQTEAEEKWREEKNRRLAESRVQWAQERQEKDAEEIRRLAKKALPPELTESQKIRAWAKEHGYGPRDRGAIPAHIREAYRLATAGQEALSVVTG
ncbi:hypothetical protein [Streptomyces sp. NPDC018045]|uniref:Lsr2 family DNA-binding protein n=1 Tax=Streptomyces sp. NPDC018045 TaxID=3365037 RepID=UPI0037ADCABF